MLLYLIVKDLSLMTLTKFDGGAQDISASLSSAGSDVYTKQESFVIINQNRKIIIIFA